MHTRFAVIAACLFLAGCWEAKGSLYGDAKPVQPLRAGKVVSFSPDKPGERSHAVLAQARNGFYRLTNTDKGPDQGDMVRLRLFAVPGLPQGMFLFEAVMEDKCRPGASCRPVNADSGRDYGLVRLTKMGAEVLSPDCSKTSPAAKFPGVTASDYGICRFTSRAGLEAAARDQAGRRWQPNLIYRYE